VINSYKLKFTELKAKNKNNKAVSIMIPRTQNVDEGTGMLQVWLTNL